jgi:aspartate kinase
MALIVQKYGGTSVADINRIHEVAKRVAGNYDRGDNIIVVLSAMAGATDNLISMANQVTESPERRELDVLMATGEQTTAALLAITLMSMGYPAQSLLGYQAEVRTNGDHCNARIIDIGATRINGLIRQRKIVVVAGFQGCDSHGNITTLGRGGSDTTAVAIAATAKADLCEIYTDVDGIYTTDPNICEKARKLDFISYNEILEMASLGTKVLQIRSVEFAKKYNVPVHVRSSFNEKEGTMVVNEYDGMEKIVVSGITCNKNEARITLRAVPDQPGVVAKIFTPLAQEGIQVDMIIQNTRSGGMTDVTFTVTRGDFKRAVELSEKVVQKIGGETVLTSDEIAKVSVTGVGMKNHSGVAATMFAALADENINIRLISTSEIRISCVVQEKYAELAVRVLHSAFGLDQKSSESNHVNA